MEAVKIVEKQATVTCTKCDTSFKTRIQENETKWMNFMFTCPVCQTMNCVSRKEMI